VSRQSLVISVALTGLLLGVSACGGSGGDKADPKSTKATTSAGPVQPKGADGVTYDIGNWGKYADDPVVLAYKKTTEAINASTNRGKLLPAMRHGLSKSLLRQYAATLQEAWKKKWHVSDVGSATVRSASTTGSQARLVMCEWRPSFGFRDKNDKPVGTADPWWDKVDITMKSVSDRWIISSAKVSGKCPGGAPA
jgi:hypothetical protein